MVSDVRIGVLGPLQIWRAEEPVDLGGSRLRLLLIRLTVDAGRVVPASRLVEDLWDDGLPAAPANALQSLVSRLRRVLPEAVESHAAGYRLTVSPDRIDVARFEALARSGRQALAGGEPAAGDILRDGLALWRGPAYLDAAEAAFVRADAVRLEELRRAALEDRIDADLAAGRGGELVAELEGLVAAYPHREGFSGQLMRALAAAGRQAEALDAYERFRGRLAEDLGVDPSAELRATHLAVLQGAASASTARPGPRQQAPSQATASAGRPPTAAAQYRSSDRHGPVGGAPAHSPVAGRRTSNLRAQITSFVGRDDDLERIARMFAETRLVTLTGPGGAGKTRLATEAAARLAPRLCDGAWLVELAPIIDPVDLPPAVLSVLGAREAALLARAATALTPSERLADTLAEKDLLLVVDNCEHLVADAAALVDMLLASCPRLRVLATSREPLGITGEMLYPVGPLALPPETASPAEALTFAAVRLLADRGCAVAPTFAVDETTVAPVVRICRSLDGIPLAIELAAARLRAMSAEQIATRLDDRFRLLTGGARVALPRHRTLRAVVDWSWDLLRDQERVLARRLAVFAGGATLEAAERVCSLGGAGDVALVEFLDVITALVDRSLVVAGATNDSPSPGADAYLVGSAGHPEGNGTRGDPVSRIDASGNHVALDPATTRPAGGAPAGGGPAGGPSDDLRYSMLETVRAYGDERAREAGEYEAVRHAHARYFLELVERAEPLLRSRDQLRWMAVLTREQDNLHAALRWSIDTGEAELALRLVSGMSWYWLLRSVRAEAREWARQALALPGDAPAAVRAEVLLYRGLTALSAGLDAPESMSLMEEALDILATLPADELRRRSPALSLAPLMVAMFRRADQDAIGYGRELMRHPDPWTRHMAYFNTAELLLNVGEATAAEATLDRALAGFRELGERWGLGHALVARATLSASRGRHDESVAALREAREVFGGLGDREDIVHILILLAHSYTRTGRLSDAHANLAAAGALAHEIGTEDQKTVVSVALADLARLEGRLDDARRLADEGVAMAARLDLLGHVHTIALCSRGRIDVVAGDLEGARRWYAAALPVALGSQDQPITARVLDLRADIELAAGDTERATTLLGTAESLRGMPEHGDPETTRITAAAQAALGPDRFARLHAAGTARPPEEIMAALREEAGGASARLSSSGDGPTAAPVARTPP